MSLKGIIALRQRGSNTPTGQLEDAFKTLGVKGAIVDADAFHGVDFIEVHTSDPHYMDWFVRIAIGLILLIELGRAVFSI